MRDTIVRALVGEPEVRGEAEHRFRFRFGPGETVFEGHFPGFPLLPGIFQIEMTRFAAELAADAENSINAAPGYRIDRVDRCKFVRMIRPEEMIDLALTRTFDGQTVRARARISVAGEKAGEVTLTLSPAESEPGGAAK